MMKSKKAIEAPWEVLIVVLIITVIILIILVAFSTKGFTSTNNLFEGVLYKKAGLR